MHWWIRHDWINFKVPVSNGEVLIPHDFLMPNFEPPTERLAYEFLGGKKDQRKIADFAGWSDAAFFVSDRGFDSLRPMFEKHGRRYQVSCSGLRYSIVLIDTLIDAFDDRRSQFDRSGIEKELREDISRFHHIVLPDGFSTDADIFRLDGSFALATNIIVSDRFKQTYEANALTGLTFYDTAPVAPLTLH